MEFVYLVFTRMPGEVYRRRFGSFLLCSFELFRRLINSLCLIFKFHEGARGGYGRKGGTQLDRPN